MQSAYDRAVAMGQDPDKLRTWLQDFSLGTPYYGESEVRAQIDATYDVGLDSYMSWDPKNKYTNSAVIKNTDNLIIEEINNFFFNDFNSIEFVVIFFE